MGFWSTFFSAQECKNCGSYNTYKVDFQDLPKAVQDVYWDTAGRIRPEKTYRCKNCKHVTIKCENGQYFWTCPKR